MESHFRIVIPFPQSPSGCIPLNKETSTFIQGKLLRAWDVGPQDWPICQALILPASLSRLHILPSLS